MDGDHEYYVGYVDRSDDFYFVLWPALALGVIASIMLFFLPRENPNYVSQGVNNAAGVWGLIFSGFFFWLVRKVAESYKKGSRDLQRRSRPSSERVSELRKDFVRTLVWSLLTILVLGNTYRSLAGYNQAQEILYAQALMFLIWILLCLSWSFHKWKKEAEMRRGQEK